MTDMQQTIFSGLAVEALAWRLSGCLVTFINISTILFTFRILIVMINDPHHQHYHGHHHDDHDNRSGSWSPAEAWLATDEFDPATSFLLSTMKAFGG